MLCNNVVVLTGENFDKTLGKKKFKDSIYSLFMSTRFVLKNKLPKSKTWPACNYRHWFNN